jgi:hypothetical protein
MGFAGVAQAPQQAGVAQLVPNRRVKFRFNTAGSSERKKFGELLRWFHDSECLPGTVVQAA